ncbi:MAG: PQQ-binding-like beta-propeller repeat protein [Tannerella sp.]|jgi:outer membrane protein assembly factor BamB|nr:PQQ-binding-like beta-propeller repeat protein [Tannerella sp.]
MKKFSIRRFSIAYCLFSYRSPLSAVFDIVCTRTGIVSILNAKTGELAWEYDTGEQITASPAVIKGAFYILTSKGTLFCFGE